MQFQRHSAVWMKIRARPKCDENAAELCAIPSVLCAIPSEFCAIPSVCCPIRLSWDRSLGGGEATDISTILLPNAPVLLPLSLLIVAPGSKLHVLGFRCKVLLLFQVSCMRYLLREATDILTILLPNTPVLLPLSLLIVLPGTKFHVLGFRYKVLLPLFYYLSAC